MFQISSWLLGLFLKIKCDSWIEIRIVLVRSVIMIRFINTFAAQLLEKCERVLGVMITAAELENLPMQPVFVPGVLRKLKRKR